MEPARFFRCLVGALALALVGSLHAQSLRIFDRLDILTDVSIVNPTNGQLLEYSGGAWHNTDPAVISYPVTTIFGRAGNVTLQWGDLSPFSGTNGTTFALGNHTHTKSQITDFAHTHLKADIIDFPPLPIAAAATTHKFLTSYTPATGAFTLGQPAIADLSDAGNLATWAAITPSTTNIGEGINLYFTNARAIAAPLTGFVANAGTITSSDTILVALQKIVGNFNTLGSLAFVAPGFFNLNIIPSIDAAFTLGDASHRFAAIYSANFYGGGANLTSLAAANITGSHTLPDGVLSTNVPLLNQAGTYAAGAKQTVQSSASTAGFRHAGVTADPSSLAEGDQWYRSDTHRQMLDNGTQPVVIDTFGWQTVADGNATILPTTRTVVLTQTLTAQRTYTLPAANSVPVGWPVTVINNNNYVTNFSAKIQASGSDAVNGSTFFNMTTQDWSPTFISDGVSKWALPVLPVALGGTSSTTAGAARTALGVGTMGQQSASSIAVTGGTMAGVTITGGSVADASLSANVTKQGNTFNGANQLVQTNASSRIPPALISGGTGTLDLSSYTVTLPNAMTFQIRQGTLAELGTITLASGEPGYATDTKEYFIGDGTMTGGNKYGWRVVSPPATSTSTGTAGTVAIDANYFYYCTATNTWKRVALTTW